MSIQGHRLNETVLVTRTEKSCTLLQLDLHTNIFYHRRIIKDRRKIFCLGNNVMTLA
jgi:hypothetical protein